MDATIRPASAADHDRLHDIDVATWSPLSTPAPPPPPDRNLFDRRPPEDFLVAEGDGTIVGYIALGHPTPLAASTHVIEVQGLAVDPAAMRRGIGSALVDAAVAEARRRRARKISLRVLAHNDGARRLYERAGFAIEGHLVGEFILDDHAVDDLLMARHLV